MKPVRPMLLSPSPPSSRAEGYGCARDPSSVSAFDAVDFGRGPALPVASPVSPRAAVEAEAVPAGVTSKARRARGAPRVRMRRVTARSVLESDVWTRRRGESVAAVRRQVAPEDAVAGIWGEVVAGKGWVLDSDHRAGARSRVKRP